MGWGEEVRYYSIQTHIIRSQMSERVSQQERERDKQPVRPTIQEKGGNRVKREALLSLAATTRDAPPTNQRGVAASYEASKCFPVSYLERVWTCSTKYDHNDEKRSGMRKGREKVCECVEYSNQPTSAFKVKGPEAVRWLDILDVLYDCI